MATIAFTIFDRGCYGDGAFGHQHTRERCAAKLQQLARILESTDNPKYACKLRAIDGLIDELRGEMSDDASEELDACELLNEHTPSEAHWGWDQGDFGLWTEVD